MRPINGSPALVIHGELNQLMAPGTLEVVEIAKVSEAGILVVLRSLMRFTRHEFQCDREAHQESRVCEREDDFEMEAEDHALATTISALESVNTTS